MAVILVVEDEILYRTLISTRLAAAGHSVVLANNGLEAAKMMSHWKDRFPSLVITDQKMPGLSGYEVIRVLRSESAMRNIPVLMLTAYPGVVRDIVDLDDFELLDKMTAPETILETVDRMLALNPPPPEPPAKPLVINRGFVF